MARVPRVLFHLLDMADKAITGLVLVATRARPELFLGEVVNYPIVTPSLKTLSDHLTLH